MAGSAGQRVIDTMIGFPGGLRRVRVHPSAVARRRVPRRVRLPRRAPVQRGAQGAPTADPMPVTLAEMDRFGVDIGWSGCTTRRGELASTAPDRFVGPAPSSSRTPAWRLRRMGAARREYEELRRSRLRRVPCRLRAPGRHRRPADVPDLRQVRGARTSDLRVCRRPGPPAADVAAAGGADRPGDVRLPRARVRDPARVRAVDRAGREADAEVAQSALLDVGVRAEVLPAGGDRLRQHPGRGTVLYAGYFPMGLSLERIFGDMPSVPFKEHVWPKFLYDNAARILGLAD